MASVGSEAGEGDDGDGKVMRRSASESKWTAESATLGSTTSELRAQLRSERARADAEAARADRAERDAAACMQRAAAQARSMVEQYAQLRSKNNKLGLFLRGAQQQVKEADAHAKERTLAAEHLQAECQRLKAELAKLDKS